MEMLHISDNEEIQKKMIEEAPAPKLIAGEEQAAFNQVFCVSKIGNIFSKFFLFFTCSPYFDNANL
jgi:hypothetical protein